MVRQEPQHACNGSITECTPIDPVPIIQHRAFDPSAHGYYDVNQNTATYTLSASLAKPDDDVELWYLKTLLNRHSRHPLQHFTDVEHDSEVAAFFVFSDLRVNAVGRFRLKFSLFQTVKDNPMKLCKTTYCAPFHVYPVRKFPGMGEPTPLSRSLVDQGVRLRIREDRCRMDRESWKQDCRGQVEDGPDTADGSELGWSEQILPPRPLTPNAPVGPALGMPSTDFEPPQVISPPPPGGEPSAGAEIPGPLVRDSERGSEGGYRPCDPPQHAIPREASMRYPPWHAPEFSSVRFSEDRDPAIRHPNKHPLSAHSPAPAPRGDTPSPAVLFSSHSGFLSNSHHPIIGSGTFNDVYGSQYNICSFGQGSTQPLLESALELSNTLQAQHAATLSTVSALKSDTSFTHKSLVHQLAVQEPAIVEEQAAQELAQECKSLMQMLNECKDMDGHWSTIKEEWSQERERLRKGRAQSTIDSSSRTNWRTGIRSAPGLRWESWR